MSRRAPDRWPISSDRSVKSGISWRDRVPRRTRSAASASRRTGPAMAPARNSDSTIITMAATRKTCSRANRSDAMMVSMSPPCVDSSSTPWTERRRWIGTATETMVSPRALVRTSLERSPAKARWTSGRDLPLAGPDLVEDEPFLGAEQRPQAVPAPLDEGELLVRNRRQVHAQDVAARIEGAGIEQQRALAVVDARAGLGRRHQPPQQRRDPLRIDREFEAKACLREPRRVSRLHLEQLVGIDGDGVGFDRRRTGDRAGDDLALRHQATDPRLDQALAELVEVEKADQQGHEPRKVEHHDAARQARGGALAQPAAERLELAPSHPAGRADRLPRPRRD